MHWIAVHEDVFGSKLRGFRKSVGCSEAEALGILTVVWLWARKNTDMTGLLGNVDRADIAKEIRGYISSSLDAFAVTDAMIEHGWIDDIDGKLYVHDWYEWQQYWYNYLDKKEKDKERKRLEREKRKNEASSTPQTPQKASEEPDTGETPAEDEKEKKATKKKYADHVKMQEKEYDKLVEQYGEAFTEKLIEELNNYKGANGKKYKSDYLAILNWVVEKCERKYPGLKKTVVSETVSQGENPFANYK